MSDADRRFTGLPKTEADCEVEILRLLELRRPRRRVAAVARLQDWLHERELEAFARESAASEVRARARMARFETCAGEMW